MMKISINYLATFLLLGFSTAACGGNSWDKLTIEATTIVDGHAVVSRETWRTRVVETFPSGSRSPVIGRALIIPIAPGIDVYGLLRGTTKLEISDASLIPNILDSYVISYDQKSGRAQNLPASKSALRRYVVTQLLGRSIPICTANPQYARQDNCILFVYFKNYQDPKSAERIEPGTGQNIRGHSVRIVSVRLGYSTYDRTTNGEAKLPDWLRSVKGSFLSGDRDRNNSSISGQINATDFGR